MWQSHSSKIQVSRRKTSLDGSAQRRPQASRQGAFKISLILKIRTSKILFTCSGMSIRLETLSSSWSLNFQSGIKRASFPFRLSAIQAQTGQVVNNQGSQQVVHWFQYSMFIFSQQVELKLQLLIHQRKASSMQWLKQQWNHLQSRTSFRNSAQRFCHLRSALSFRRIYQQENQWLQD